MPIRPTNYVFDQLNFSQIPDRIFDYWIYYLTGAEFKVLTFICRRTFGFRRDHDTVSLAQICDGIVTRSGRRLCWGTGLSPIGARKALSRLKDLGLVLCEERYDEEKKMHLSHIFWLNIKAEVDDEGYCPGKNKPTEGALPAAPEDDEEVPFSEGGVGNSVTQGEEGGGGSFSYPGVGNSVTQGVGNSVAPQHTEIQHTQKQHTQNPRVPFEQNENKTTPLHEDHGVQEALVGHRSASWKLPDGILDKRNIQEEQRSGDSLESGQEQEHSGITLNALWQDATGQMVTRITEPAMIREFEANPERLRKQLTEYVAQAGIPKVKDFLTFAGLKNKKPSQGRASRNRAETGQGYVAGRREALRYTQTPARASRNATLDIRDAPEFVQEWNRRFETAKVRVWTQEYEETMATLLKNPSFVDNQEFLLDSLAKLFSKTDFTGSFPSVIGGLWVEIVNNKFAWKLEQAKGIPGVRADSNAQRGADACQRLLDKYEKKLEEEKKCKSTPKP